jgi:cobalamin biosynthesis protein CobD/CbiB
LTSDLRPLWFGTIEDNHQPRWVRRTAVSKRELKGALVVVVGVVVVVTTTVSTLISNLRLPVLWLSFVDLGP